MSNRKKRLQKLLSGHNELSFLEIKTVLSDFGYVLVRIKGSHHIFKGMTGDNINLPVHNGKVNKYYRKRITDTINKYLKYDKKM